MRKIVFSHPNGFSSASFEGPLKLCNHSEDGTTLRQWHLEISVPISSFGWRGNMCFAFSSDTWINAVCATFFRIYSSMPGWTCVVPVDFSSCLYESVSEDRLSIFKWDGIEHSWHRNWTGTMTIARWPSSFWILHEMGKSHLMKGTKLISRYSGFRARDLFEIDGVLFVRDAENSKLTILSSLGRHIQQFAFQYPGYILDLRQNKQWIAVIGAHENAISVMTIPKSGGDMANRLQLPNTFEICLSGAANSIVCGDGRLIKIDSGEITRWGSI